MDEQQFYIPEGQLSLDPPVIQEEEEEQEQAEDELDRD